MAKVLLINPNSRFIEKSWACRRFCTPMPPLGLAYIGAVLEKNGIDVSIIDHFANKMADEELLILIKKDKPQLVGFSALTLVIPDIKRLVFGIRQISKEIKIVLGNSHATCLPDELLRELKIPCKEGRSAFLKLGRRKGFTLSIASAAAFGRLRDGKFDDLKVAVGAVAPIPIRSRKVEDALKDTKATDEEIEKAADMIKEEVNPITDLRASAAYRREMASLLAKRTIKKIAMG